MNRKGISLMIILALVVLITSACQSSKPQESTDAGKDSETESIEETSDPNWNYEFILGSGSATGNSKVFVTALAKAISDNVKGVRVTAAVTPGYDAESAIRTYEGSYHGGVGTPVVLTNAVAGVDPFPSEGIKLSYWFSHNEIPLNLLALKRSGISEITDLKGKTLAMGTPGTSNYVITEAVLNAHGLNLSDVKVQYMDTSEAINQMKDGHVDAMSYVRAFSGAILELATSRELVLLQPSKEAAQKLSNELPWVGPEKWPYSESYDTIEVPGEGLCFIQPEGMFIHSDLPDDVVYAMTKAVHENQIIIQQSSDVYKHFDLKNALTKVPIDPHPGALRYYKEMNFDGWQQYEHLIH